ncbi:MAG TPA: response regulator [Cytophagales bacterium]|nr:response regulator [Cytophagales bacterium]
MKSILLIDDNQVDNFINKRLIQILDLAEDVKVFNNGLEGINYLKILSQVDKGPDVVFLDLNMPVMDGLTFLKEYKELPQHFKDTIKVIVLTSSAYPVDFKTLEILGFDDYLTKPLTLEKLREKLLVNFEKSYQNDELRISGA